MTRIAQFLAALIVLFAFFLGFANFRAHMHPIKPIPIVRPGEG